MVDTHLREVGLALLVLFVTSYAWMYSRVSVPNERTRAYLAVALVDHGTLAIDEPIRRFGSVYDEARFNGHYFTDKAPGSSLLAVPIYALVRIVTQPDDWDIVALCNLFRTWLMLPFGLAGFVLLRSLLRTLGVSPTGARVSSLAFSLGSPMLHYSGAFYGHVPVAVLVLAALWWLDRAGLIAPPRWTPAAESGDSSAPSASVQHAVACGGAGACVGLAGLIEYQAIVLGVVLALPILFSPARRIGLGLAAYVSGAIPFAATLLWYNTRAFGGPFELSYQHLVSPTLQELHGFGLAGATRPTYDVLKMMLTTWHRGLLTTSPLLAFGLFALPLLFRRLGLALWLTALLATSYFVLIVSSSSVWYGGWSFGLRLLIPIYGFLAIAAAVSFDACARLPGLALALRAAAIFSVLYHQLVNVTFAELPPEFERPLPDAILPLLREGLVSPNLACKLIGLSPWTLAPFGLAMLVAVACLAWPEDSSPSLARSNPNDSMPSLGPGQRLRFRLLHTIASVVVACLALSYVWQAEPTRPEREQVRWVKHARGWQVAETRCRYVERR